MFQPIRYIPQKNKQTTTTNNQQQNKKTKTNNQQQNKLKARESWRQSLMDQVAKQSILTAGHTSLVTASSAGAAGASGLALKEWPCMAIGGGISMSWAGSGSSLVTSKPTLLPAAAAAAGSAGWPASTGSCKGGNKTGHECCTEASLARCLYWKLGGEINCVRFLTTHAVPPCMHGTEGYTQLAKDVWQNERERERERERGRGERERQRERERERDYYWWHPQVFLLPFSFSLLNICTHIRYTEMVAFTR